MIVYRNELSKRFSIEWLVNFHENLLAGASGRIVNGLGAVFVTSLCLTGAIIWWPGVKNWRRSLIVNWRANFARINWDLHSAARILVVSLYSAGLPRSVGVSWDLYLPF